MGVLGDMLKHSIANEILSGGSVFSAVEGISKFLQHEAFVDCGVITGANWKRECIFKCRLGAHEIRWVVRGAAHYGKLCSMCCRFDSAVVQNGVVAISLWDGM